MDFDASQLRVMEQPLGDGADMQDADILLCCSSARDLFRFRSYSISHREIDRFQEGDERDYCIQKRRRIEAPKPHIVTSAPDRLAVPNYFPTVQVHVGLPRPPVQSPVWSGSPTMMGSSSVLAAPNAAHVHQQQLLAAQHQAALLAAEVNTYFEEVNRSQSAPRVVPRVLEDAGDIADAQFRQYLWLCRAARAPAEIAYRLECDRRLGVHPTIASIHAILRSLFSMQNINGVLDFVDECFAACKMPFMHTDADVVGADDDNEYALAPVLFSPSSPLACSSSLAGPSSLAKAVIPWLQQPETYQLLIKGLCDHGYFFRSAHLMLHAAVVGRTPQTMLLEPSSSYLDDWRRILDGLEDSAMTTPSDPTHDETGSATSPTTPHEVFAVAMSLEDQQVPRETRVELADSMLQHLLSACTKRRSAAPHPLSISVLVGERRLLRHIECCLASGTFRKAAHWAAVAYSSPAQSPTDSGPSAPPTATDFVTPEQLGRVLSLLLVAIDDSEFDESPTTEDVETAGASASVPTEMHSEPHLVQNSALSWLQVSGCGDGSPEARGPGSMEFAGCMTSMVLRVALTRAAPISWAALSHIAQRGAHPDFGLVVWLHGMHQWRAAARCLLPQYQREQSRGSNATFVTFLAQTTSQWLARLQRHPEDLSSWLGDGPLHGMSLSSLTTLVAEVLTAMVVPGSRSAADRPVCGLDLDGHGFGGVPLAVWEDLVVKSGVLLSSEVVKANADASAARSVLALARLHVMQVVSAAAASVSAISTLPNSWWRSVAAVAADAGTALGDIWCSGSRRESWPEAICSQWSHVATSLQNHEAHSHCEGATFAAALLAASHQQRGMTSSMIAACNQVVIGASGSGRLKGWAPTPSTYVAVVDSAALVLIARSVESRQAFESMMAKYASSCGGFMLVTMESVMMLSARATSSTVGNTDADDGAVSALLWLLSLCERKGSWLRTVPLCATLHVASQQQSPKWLSVAAAANDGPGVLQLIHHVKTELSHPKVMLVTGNGSLRDSASHESLTWLKPVVHAADLLQKLGVTLLAQDNTTTS